MTGTLKNIWNNSIKSNKHHPRPVKIFLKKILQIVFSFFTKNPFSAYRKNICYNKTKKQITNFYVQILLANSARNYHPYLYRLYYIFIQNGAIILLLLLKPSTQNLKTNKYI